MSSDHLQPEPSRRTPDPEPPTRDAAAQLELSAAAQSAADAPDPRVAQIRAQIAQGTYLTPEKLDAAVEALCRELLGG